MSPPGDVRPLEQGPADPGLAPAGAHPLAGKRVLITRPAGQADDFAERLREAGAEPIVAPAIAIFPPDDVRAAADAAERAGEYGWIVFTSRNGVDAFFERLGERRLDARTLARVRIAAIGPKTAGALAAHGIRVDLMPAQFVNEAVAAALLARTTPGERILIYRAQDARDVLPDTLREHGRIVDDVAAYATRIVDDPGLRASAARADIVTFTSASSVAGFVHNVPAAGELLAAKVVAAIGPITARAARDAGIRVDVVPDAFTVEGLVRALTETASV